MDGGIVNCSLDVFGVVKEEIDGFGDCISVFRENSSLVVWI